MFDALSFLPLTLRAIVPGDFHKETQGCQAAGIFLGQTRAELWECSLSPALNTKRRINTQIAYSLMVDGESTIHVLQSNLGKLFHFFQQGSEKL